MKLFSKKIKSSIKITDKMLLAFVFISMASISSHAQVCQKNTEFSGSAWVTQPSGTEFKNGQVVASTTGSVTYYLPGVRGTVIVDGRSWNIYSNSYEVIDLPKTPGVGVRIKWGEYWTHASYNFNHSNLTPKGTVLSQNFNRNLVRGSSKQSYIITLQFDYEIVVTDSEKYKGGKLIIESDGKAFAYTSSSNGYDSATPCIGGTLDLLDALRVHTTLPELPDPPTPTCASAQVSAAVKLGSVIASQVATHGSNRSGGTNGEVTFQLTGRNCPLGTTIKAYFTDIRSKSSTEDYVRSSNPAVGFRMYHKQNTTPIQMGPAPIGSTLPTRPPVMEGPTTEVKTDMLIPITAQYVLLPGMSSENIKPGRVTAAATVTFMYD